jgi:uroporphyrinogen-III synthase
MSGARQGELKPVVVTRAESADGPLGRELKNLGLEVLLWPAVNIAPPETNELAATLGRIADFDWVVFASRHGVAAVLRHLREAPAGVRIGAVGRATAAVLRERGWPVDLVPDDPSAAALVAAFAATGAANGARILYPASSRALPTLASGLTQLGAEVVTVVAYRTESGTALDVESCRERIASQAVGAVTFASPSAVAELESALGAADFSRLLAFAPAVAIGPTTARALSERGHTPVLAESATLRGLAVSVLHALRASRGVDR